jgi:DNA adenine methylase
MATSDHGTDPHLLHYSVSESAIDRFRSIPRKQRAEPFLKWAGGKQRLLSTYDSMFPAHFENYFEPFVGGGAVFFFLLHIGRIQKRAQLSDLNDELIHLWRTVRDDVEPLIAALQTYQYEKEFYYRIRKLDTTKLSPIDRAARMLYLNRTCFNGLYRVNRGGQFNVPFGRYSNPVICNADNLRNVQRALQPVELQSWGFETVLESASTGDFLYFDPPYQPVTRTARFTQYTAEPFNESHQGRLNEIVRMLDRRGCLVMISNSDTPLVHELYKGFDIQIVQAPRAINRDGTRRGTVPEVVIRNFR